MNQTPSNIKTNKIVDSAKRAYYRLENSTIEGIIRGYFNNVLLPGLICYLRDRHLYHKGEISCLYPLSDYLRDDTLHKQDS